MGSQVNLAPPRSTVSINQSVAGPSTPPSSTYQHPKLQHAPSASGFHPPHQHHGDERSEAEKMTKREREENGLPRLTAYGTAEGYRLKLLQAFLKREHGVGVVRVFDDCIYAVSVRCAWIG